MHSSVLNQTKALNAHYNRCMKKASSLQIVEDIVQKRKQRKADMLIESRQLPLWGDAKRGLPNVFARSALFNSRSNSDAKNDTRAYMKNVEIASLSNYHITYRGEELRQDDSDVYMQLLHLAREQPLGEPVYFTAHGVIKELGWPVNGDSYRRLRECIERLSANTVKVQIKDESAGYGKSLIRSFYWRDDASGEVLSQWVVEFEKDIVLLFGENIYTLIEWRERRRIGTRATLARWLHSFLASHEKPIPLSVRKYYELSKSNCRQIYHFRAQLKKALDRLVDIGFVESFTITPGDLVELRLVPRAERAAQIQ